ncbi:MAG: carboxylating nicotinate-nucleotide diphosphorylase [Actinomycetia bacterium]|nr:carboxylating nicotinate-nucleotide diphosphorylase [Actinomycetes bacterium]
MLTLPQIDEVVAAALAEDFGLPAEKLLSGSDADVLARDVTSSSVVPADDVFLGHIAAREEAVVCGLPVAARVWEMLARAAGLEGSVSCEALIDEGAPVRRDQSVLRVSGPTRVVLSGERTALDFVMVLSGIATEAARWQAEAGDRLRVYDTRKTVPGLRALSKYAVRAGGAHNHRMGLFDLVLIKDNHLARAGGVAPAVEAARRAYPAMRIEVEAETIEQARQAAEAGADIVMLDNMDDAHVREAVSVVRAARGHHCAVEVSGAVSFDRLRRIAATGADMVSTSALSLARPLDFGLDEG